MLGNDVVDLEDVDARPETFRRRFDARVFAEVERRALAAAASDAAALRWAHWGAKEAAYKLLKQLDARTVFSPSRFIADFESTEGAGSELMRRGWLEVTGAASGVASRLALRSFETCDFVHVVALREGQDWADVVFGVETRGVGAEPRSSEDASVAVRRFALRELARELAVGPARLAIGRRERIPTLVLDGRTTERALSLSHHGRFVAFALAPRGRVRASEVGVRGGTSEQRMGRGSGGTVGCLRETAFLACGAG